MIAFLSVMCLMIGFAACHELESVADKVPVTIKCPPPDFERAEDLIVRFATSPEAVRSELTKKATDGDPLGVACDLIDVQSVLLETGRRYSEAFNEAQAGLRALDVFR